MYPEEVDRIFLLCPFFCLGACAPRYVSEAEMVEWERTGARGKGVPLVSAPMPVVLSFLPH